MKPEKSQEELAADATEMERADRAHEVAVGSEHEPKPIGRERSLRDEAVSVLSDSVLRVEVANLEKLSAKLVQGKAANMSDADAEKLRRAAEALAEAVGDIERIVDSYL